MEMPIERSILATFRKQCFSGCPKVIFGTWILGPLGLKHHIEHLRIFPKQRLR